MNTRAIVLLALIGVAPIALVLIVAMVRGYSITVVLTPRERQNRQ